MQALESPENEPIPEPFQIESKYLETYQQSSLDKGILKLAAAVLELAILDLRQFGGKNTREWFFSNDVDYPFSFLQICSLLNLNPFEIRARVKQKAFNYLP